MGWQWTREAWEKYTGSLKAKWSQALADAWDDTQRAVGPDVQASPDEAARVAEKMHRDLFATDTDPGGPGIWWNIGYQWAIESQLAPNNPESLYADLAKRLGVPAADLTASAAARRADVLTMGLLKDGKPNQTLSSGKTGFVPLIVGGLIVLSFGAACWAWVRGKQAEVELDRTSLSREALQAQVDASKDGRQLDTNAVAKIVGAAAPPASGASGTPGAGGGSSTLLMLGGGVILLAAGAFLFSRRS